MGKLLKPGRGTRRCFKALKPLSVHALAIMVSAAVSVPAFEAILWMAVPMPEKSSTVAAQHEAENAASAQEVSEPRRSSANTDLTTASEMSAPNTRSETRETGCRSQYYAVFPGASGPACARNPTSLMASWGPPSASWFRLSGGEFRVRPEDAAAGSLCACLAEQRGVARSEMYLSPIERLVFDGEQVAIDKWVCADPCADRVEVAKEESGNARW